jgi:hypothetical protein
MYDIFEVINKAFIFPFPPYDFQRRALNKTPSFDKLLLPLKVGRGKTAMATWRVLFDSLAFDVEKGIFIVPAPLVVQWCRWLKTIKHIDGTALNVLSYQGTPTARAKMDLKKADLIVMSRQIFVKDFRRIGKEFTASSNIHVVYDESQDGLRKIGNKVWRNFHQLTANKRITLLSGTPVNNPMDTYAVTKLLDPKIYPTKRSFEREHVADLDFFGKVTSWKNLDKMKVNLYKNSVLIPDSELTELPGLIVQSVPYELSSKHRKLYDEFVNEQLLTTDSGEVLDGTETNRMFHALQRFVTNPHKMDFKSVAAALHDMIWTLYNEDDSKCIVAAYYKDTNQGILDFFHSKGVYAVGCWGDHTRIQQQQNLDDFMGNDDCRVLVGNWGSMGVGTDGLQHVCYREVLAEMPLTPDRFEQLCGRIDRGGQKNKCVVKCLTAVDTIQEVLFSALLNKDDILQQITMQHTSMRELLAKG